MRKPFLVDDTRSQADNKQQCIFFIIHYQIRAICMTMKCAKWISHLSSLSTMNLQLGKAFHPLCPVRKSLQDLCGSNVLNLSLRITNAMNRQKMFSYGLGLGLNMFSWWSAAVRRDRVHQPGAVVLLFTFKSNSEVGANSLNRAWMCVLLTHPRHQLISEISLMQLLSLSSSHS